MSNDEIIQKLNIKIEKGEESWGINASDVKLLTEIGKGSLGTVYNAEIRFL